jgi:hypothetical protein
LFFYYRLAATIGALAVSVPVGIVATRPPEVAGAVVDDGTAWGLSLVNPNALRTSVSNFAIVSLLSFKNWRAFSRPWPMRSPL